MEKYVWVINNDPLNDVLRSYGPHDWDSLPVTAEGAKREGAITTGWRVERVKALAVTKQQWGKYFEKALG